MTLELDAGFSLGIGFLVLFFSFRFFSRCAWRRRSGKKVPDVYLEHEASEPDPCVADPAAEPEPELEMFQELLSGSCRPASASAAGSASGYFGRAAWVLPVCLLVLASVRSNFKFDTSSPLGTQLFVSPAAQPIEGLESQDTSSPLVTPLLVSPAARPTEVLESQDVPVARVAKVAVEPAQGQEAAIALVDDDANAATASSPDVTTPSKLVSVALTRQVLPVHTIDNIAYFKSSYYGDIKVGSPAQSYKVVFDTGSGHLILPSRYCYSETCRAHNRYSRSQSRSAVDMDYDGQVVAPTEPRDQITVSFGTGEVTGIFIQEVVCFTDDAAQDWSREEKRNFTGVATEHHQASQLPIGCQSLRFIAATAMSDDPFKTFHFDGVLGLGLPGVSQAPAFNFLHTLAQTSPDWGITNPQTFAVFLAESGNDGSEITFGGARQEHLDGDVYWNDVLNPEVGHWIVRIKSVRVDGETVDFCEDGLCKAVADTGTSLLGVPVNSFTSLYRLLWHPSPMDGMCRGTGPKLHIDLEHITLTLTPEDYAHASGFSARQAQQNANVPPPWGAPFSGGEEERFGPTRFDVQCKPMLMSMDHPEPIGPKLFILGEPVLRKYYTVYDTEQKRIGFGRASHVDEVPSDPPVVDSENWFWEDELEED